MLQALTVPSLPEMLQLQPIPNKPGLVFPVEIKSPWGVPILCRGVLTASELSPVPVATQHMSFQGQGEGLLPPGASLGSATAQVTQDTPVGHDCTLTFGVEQLAVPVHVCQEEAVDQGGLAQPGFP